ncbi:hypothetical protein BD770DRAFT_412461 [Pilaira anomala]|nr:hypothetical protein BD770DRAFT_412461 [Pilaira anomala]
MEDQEVRFNENHNAFKNKIETIEKVENGDNIFVNNSNLSVGTKIKRAAMTKHLNYTNLNASDIALVNCGLNSILDLTSGSLTNQKFLFTKEEWTQIKNLFPHIAINDSSPRLNRIYRIFKDTNDMSECYWNAKDCQRYASSPKERLGYELIALTLDKMIKHPTIFTLSKPTPSEADIMIKVWADLFEVLFCNTGLYIRWGEKGLITQDDGRTIFKLDAKLVQLFDDEEYPVSCLEFAPYSGPKKIKSDRNKLLVEAKAIYNEVRGLQLSEENKSGLKIVNIQIMGLEAHVASLTLAADNLYVAKTIDSFMIPSTTSQLKEKSESLITQLHQYKVEKNKNHKSIIILAVYFKYC